jgi:hypothetical protein
MEAVQTLLVDHRFEIPDVVGHGVAAPGRLAPAPPPHFDHQNPPRAEQLQQGQVVVGEVRQAG